MTVPRWLLLVLVFLTATLCYALTVQSHMFSDGPHILGMARERPVPSYNAIYVPAGWLLHRGLEPLLGWSARTALEWLSVLSSAGAATLVAAALLRLGHGRVLVASLTLFLVVTPAVWFFATTLEVHGVQFLGVALAFWLVVRARSARTAIAILLVALALLLAVRAHLTCVLLAPALLLVPLDSRRQGGGYGWRGLGGALALGLALLALSSLAIHLWTSWAQDERSQHESARMLAGFAGVFLQHLQLRGLFAPDEIASYLSAELWRPFFLWIPLLLVTQPFAWRRDRAMVVATLLAALLYLAVFTQGGVWERGAYYLSLMPFAAAVVAAGATSMAGTSRTRLALVSALLAAAALPQALSARDEVVRFNTGLTADRWTAFVRAHCPRGSLVLTAELPRWHALAAHGREYDTVALRKSIDLWPRRHRARAIDPILQQAGDCLTRGRAVFVDAPVLDPSAEQPASVREFAQSLCDILAPVRGELESVPDGDGATILFRIRLPG